MTVLRCANVLGPDVETGVHADVRAAGGADGARLRPAASVRPRGRRRPRARARGDQRRRRAPSTSPPTASSRSRRRSRCSASAPLPLLPPVGGRACSPAPLRRLGLRIPDEMTNLLRFGRGLDNRLLQGDRLPLRLHLARDRAPARRAPAPGADPARPRRRRGLPLRARGRGVPALEPARAPRARRRRAASRPTASRSGSEAPRCRRRTARARGVAGAVAPYTLYAPWPASFK